MRQVLLLILTTLSAPALADAIDQSIARSFKLTTGLAPLPLDVAQIRKDVVENGQLNGDKLFAKLFADPAFLENRVATFISKMSNEENLPFEKVDDFQVALLLATVHDIPFTDLLSRPFKLESKLYQLNQPGFSGRQDTAYNIGNRYRSYVEIVQDVSLLNAEVVEQSKTVYRDGLMSTHGFANRSLRAGTNRRGVRAAFDLFLCAKIDSWKDASLDDFYVGRDVDRKPGENPETYQQVCRGCHAPMDAMRGAMAYYEADFNGNASSYDYVVRKYNQNETMFPSGYETKDAGWENLLTSEANRARFGWRGATQGQGLLSFSKMIAQSRQFQTCVTQRLTASICDYDDAKLRPVLQSAEFKALADQYRTEGYSTKKLIRHIVESGLCKN